jgi:thymidylate synthase
MKAKNEQFIVAESLGEAWLHCLELVANQGALVRDDSERLFEVCPFVAHIRSIDPSDPILAKYADQERIKLMLHKYSFCGVLPQYKISYGKLLYDHRGVNQVDCVIDRLRRKRESKSATIGLQIPGEAIMSCLSTLDFKIRNEELQVVAMYRSQNVFASQPGNMLAIHEIQAKVADALSCFVGSVILLAASAHIYERDLVAVKAVLEEAQSLTH